MKQIGVLLLLLTVLFAGCSGSDATEIAPDPTPTTDTSAVPPTPTEDPNVFTPKFHTHDYWAGRPSMYLFEDTVQIGQDALGETAISNSGIIIGTTTFDTQDDGDDSRSSDKTDVVYQGTERIDVMLTWTDANQIPGINFYYKPANSPQFVSLGPLESGATASIFLRPHMADMPHQVSLSRWKFKIEAFDPQTQAMPMRAYRAMGEVAVEMQIFNGGDQFIDPPHPYFFTSGPTRFAGEVNKTFSNCVFVNNTKHHESQPDAPQQAIAYGCTLEGFAPEPRNIVPWETTTVVLELWYNYTSAASVPRTMGLKFHASDSNEYRYPTPKDTTAGYARYEIEVSESMTDSPYANDSDWRFGVYPIVQDQGDLGSEMTGNVHILSTAISDGAQGRGMGN